jgi:hypothetical protein
MSSSTKHPAGNFARKLTLSVDHFQGWGAIHIDLRIDRRKDKEATSASKKRAVGKG